MIKAFLVALAISILGGVTATPSAVHAQEVTVRYPHLRWHPASLHYHRVYQGRYWVWSADIGWNQQDFYIDVPHWMPGYYTADPCRTTDEFFALQSR